MDPLKDSMIKNDAKVLRIEYESCTLQTMEGMTTADIQHQIDKVDYDLIKADSDPILKRDTIKKMAYLQDVLIASMSPPPVKKKKKLLQKKTTKKAPAKKAAAPKKPPISEKNTPPENDQ